MAKENSFREELNCPEATKVQEKVAKETIKSEIFRQLADHKVGSKLEELVKEIANKYSIEDNSHILEMIVEELNSGRYLYKVNEEGYLISNYSKHDIFQKQFHDRKNKEANEKLQSYIEKAKDIFNNLPEEERFNERAIEAGFGQYDWETEHLWIELAVAKVWKCDLKVCTQPKENEELML